MQEKGLKMPWTSSITGSTKQQSALRPALGRSSLSWLLGCRWIWKITNDFLASGQFCFGTGSSVLPIAFLPLLLHLSLHPLLQAMPVSFLLQVNGTNKIISKHSGCPPASSLGCIENFFSSILISDTSFSLYFLILRQVCFLAFFD